MASKLSPKRKPGSVATGKEKDGWTCKLCQTNFTEEKAEILECKYCGQHFCRKCLNLSGPEYKLLNKRTDLHWYCPPCEEKTLRNLKTERDVEERCKAFMEKMEQRVQRLEADVAKKTDIEQVKAIIKEEKQREESDTGAVVIKEVEEKIADLRESEGRKSNIIVHRCPEAQSDQSEKRKEENREVVDKLCNIMKTDSGKVKSVVRLGKREEKDLKLGIAHDFTVKERKQNKEKIEEMRKLNEENQSGEYKFIVRGPPWERKVAKVKRWSKIE